MSRVVGEEGRNARESLRHTFDEQDRERLIGALAQDIDCKIHNRELITV